MSLLLDPVILWYKEFDKWRWWQKKNIFEEIYVCSSMFWKVKSFYADILISWLDWMLKIDFNLSLDGNVAIANVEWSLPDAYAP